MTTRKSSLETFLANTLPSTPVNETQTDPSSIDEAAGRTVVLTILAQATEPVSLDQLAIKSELDDDQTARVLELLEKEDLVLKDEATSTYRLTKKGLRAADLERSRLLSPR
jgi:DNA-binding IclR family transcriptional regulator